MKGQLGISVASGCLLLLLLNTCTYKKIELNFSETGYPDDIAKIIVTKCAVSGCHNNKSMEAAGGLSLETWDRMFQGANGGAVVIPFRTDFSTLLYYTNTDSSKGPALLPTMPYNAPALSEDEYNLLSNWIQNGAPNNEGFIRFSDYASKPKLYVSNHGCDVVSIVDPESGLVMRYIDVGTNETIEAPSMVKVSPDGLYWYVIFSLGSAIQKFKTSDNLKVGEIHIGAGNWTSISITSDSRKAFITDASLNGRIVYLDTEEMEIVSIYEGQFKYPYSSCLNSENNTLYVTASSGNYIYKIDITDPLIPVVNEVSLETGNPVNYSSSLNPNSILFNQDESKYFVTCEKSSELRTLQTSNDSLVNTIPMGSNPAAMCLATSSPYLFISCKGAPGTVKQSAIFIIDPATDTYVTEVNAGYDSKGIALDEINQKLFVANRNISIGSPAGHHAALCEGKNGNLTAIDINTLLPIPDYKAELSVDPYDIGF